MPDAFLAHRQVDGRDVLRGRDLLDFLTGRLLSLPMAYFTTRRTGDIERRLAGVGQVRQFLVEGSVGALMAAMQLLAVLALMFIYSWQLALVYVVLAPCYALLMRYSAIRLRPMLESMEEGYGKYQSQQIDAIRGIETVKALAAEEGFRRMMLARFSQIADRMFRSEFLIMSYQGAIQLVTFLSLALFLVFGGLLVIDHQLTLGQFVAFNALVALGNGPVIVLLSLWDELQYSRVMLDRLSDVVEHEPEQGEDTEHLRTVTTALAILRWLFSRSRSILSMTRPNESFGKIPHQRGREAGSVFIRNLFPAH